LSTVGLCLFRIGEVRKVFDGYHAKPAHIDERVDHYTGSVHGQIEVANRDGLEMQCD
jgi:hypothetical protein